MDDLILQFNLNGSSIVNKMGVYSYPSYSNRMYLYTLLPSQYTTMFTMDTKLHFYLKKHNKRKFKGRSKQNKEMKQSFIVYA